MVADSKLQSASGVVCIDRIFTAVRTLGGAVSIQNIGSGVYGVFVILLVQRLRCHLVGNATPV